MARGIRWLLRPSGTSRVVLCLGALAALGCSAIEHGYRTREVAGRTLALSSEAGRERLRLETAYDSAVVATTSEHGEPTYLHVEDRDHLFLFYPDDDLVVIVVREGRPPGQVSEDSPIPGHFFRLLPKTAVAQIQRARDVRKAAQPRVRRAPRTVVASPDPDAGAVQITGFDLETFVTRFRKPMSAADPGVSGWREVVDRDGNRMGVARAGRTEYRVRRDLVTASTVVARSSRSASADVNNGMVRVNHVVFGTRAASISRSLKSVIGRIAADPSGRTRFARRVAGRTVRIERDVRAGRIVYAVSPD